MKMQKEALLITPEMIKPSSKYLEVIGAINPAAVRGEDGKIILYVRVIERLKVLEDKQYFYSPRMVGDTKYELKIDKFRKKEVANKSEFDIIFHDTTKRLTFISHLRRVILDESGFNIISIDKEPTFYGISGDSELGIEDPRIVQIEGKYVMTYVSLSRKENISTSVAISEDLKTWERKGIIFGEQDKDVVIFPEKIKERYVAFDRPEGNFQFTPPHIWIGYSDDLISWGNLKSINLVKKGDKDYGRIGPGCPPIKTNEGWLLIYHTVRSEIDEKNGELYIYSASAALFDLKNPKKLLAKSDPIIMPDQEYELKLYQKKRVVFPTGVVVDKNGKDLILYSGGRDVITSVRKMSLKKIMESLKKVK
jgi:beta-1,2-mannobiose phosphorylase / 1,2-beta-oligomannan phosphorylase